MKETENSTQEARLRTLLDAARLLNSTLELKEVTQIILDVVRAEVPVDRISVFVVDKAGNCLRSLVAQGVPRRDILVPLGKGIAGTVATTGEILDTPDAYADPRFERSFDQRLGYYTHDLFTLPVYNRQDEIIGVLQLLNRERPITAGDREFLLGISVYIGLALQNAWSHEQLRTEGDFDGQLLTLRDRLAEAERRSITSQLFDHVLHEINSPLALAMGYAELARGHEGLPPDLASHLEKIANGVDQIATAARRFRSAIDSANLHRVPLSLADILKQISRLRAKEWAAQKINASLLIQDAPEILADEGQMQLALLSLLKNAENAIAQSGDDRELRITVSGEAERARIEIFDAGSTGIPVKETSSKSTFTATRQFSGTTFRLALASSIVEQHQGRLRQSHGEKGNSVVLEFPAHMSDLSLDHSDSNQSS